METHVRRALSGFALMSLFWTTSSAQAQRFTAMPISLRIEGFVRPKRDGVVPQATWVVRVQEKNYTLQVMRLEVLTGNTSYFDIISALEPYVYAFTIYGDDDALRALTQALPDQRLVIIGTAQLNQLPGSFFLSSVDTVPALTPVPSTPGS